MSFTLPILPKDDHITAPTPQNTPYPYVAAPISLRAPTVPDIPEEDDLKAVQAQMLGMVQGKLAGLVGQSSGYIESLPVGVKLNVEGLKGLQAKQVELQNQYKREALELEKKYLALQTPLFVRRHAIVTGAAVPTAKEIEEGEEYSIKDDAEYSPLPKDASPAVEGIPEFWLTVLRSHVGLSELITDRDAAALKHLIDVRLVYLDDNHSAPETKGKPGFKIVFVFTPNEFFENEVLEKTYVYQEEVGYSGDFMYDRAIGTEIRWKEDKDLTKEFEIKRQRNKNTNLTRLVKKARPTDSFFTFFSPPTPPAEGAIENGELDEYELEELEEKLETDYQIGEDLKEKIIPRAVDYFTGKALEYDVVEDEDYEDDDDDDDEAVEEESESEAEVPRRPAKGGDASANVNPEECKQQ